MNGGGYQPSAMSKAGGEPNILGKRPSFGEGNSTNAPRFGENSREHPEGGMN